MKIGAVNNYNNDMCEEIRLIASEGFDFVDLTLEPLFSSKLDINSVKEVFNETGLGVVGHTSAFLPVIFPLYTIRQAVLEEFEKYIDFFSKLDVKLMNVHPSSYGALMGMDEMIKSNNEFISKVNVLCREKGITLMVENILKPFNTPGIFKKLLEGLDDVKVHLDIGHCNVDSEGDLVEEFFLNFGERIVHIHFSDNSGEKDDHLPLGCGTIDWKNTLSIMKKYGYDSTVTLEIFTQDRRNLLQSKKYMEEISGLTGS